MLWRFNQCDPSLYRLRTNSKCVWVLSSRFMNGPAERMAGCHELLYPREDYWTRVVTEPRGRGNKKSIKIGFCFWSEEQVGAKGMSGLDNVIWWLSLCCRLRHGTSQCHCVTTRLNLSSSFNFGRVDVNNAHKGTWGASQSYITSQSSWKLFKYMSSIARNSSCLVGMRLVLTDLS